MVMYYIYLWHKSYKDSLLQTNILGDYLNVINYNEIDDYIIENKDAIVYVSVLGDENINKFELKFRNVIKDNNLRDVLLYLDVSGYDKYTVNSKFGTDSDYPYLVVYTNGEITDIYKISDKGYKASNIIKYLNRIGAIDND